MSWLRRHHETLNEKLLREAGYSSDGAALVEPNPAEDASAEAEPVDERPKPDSELAHPPKDLVTRPAAGPPREWDAFPRLGDRRPRPRDADAFATAKASGLRADTYSFVSLEDGSLIVQETCSDDLSVLADAVELQLKPPYRADADRQEADVWAILGWRIHVVRLNVDGDELDLTSVEGVRTYAVDGETADEKIAPVALASAGEARSSDYATHAYRIDGDLWEVHADPL